MPKAPTRKDPYCRTIISRDTGLPIHGTAARNHLLKVIPGGVQGVAEMTAEKAIALYAAQLSHAEVRARAGAGPRLVKS